jgi:hypothetical protein
MDTVVTIIHQVDGITQVILIVGTLPPFFLVCFVSVHADCYIIVLDLRDRLIRDVAIV